MNDRRPFLDTIIASPDDAGPRLVFADWLDERGDPGGGWLRLLAGAWDIARELLADDPYGRGDVRDWHDRLARREPSGRLARLWACTAVRFQPLTFGRRLGEALIPRRGRVALAAAELGACGLIDRQEIEAAAAGRLRAGKGLNPLAVLVCKAARAVAREAADDAIELAAAAAGVSGVRPAAARRWQVALACRLLDQPLPDFGRPPGEQRREEKAEAWIAVRPAGPGI